MKACAVALQAGHVALEGVDLMSDLLGYLWNIDFSFYMTFEAEFFLDFSVTFNLRWVFYNSQID